MRVCKHFKNIFIPAVLCCFLTGCENANEKLVNAVWARDVDRVEKLLEEGADVNYRAKNGKTPLHIALTSLGLRLSVAPVKKIITLVLEKGADPEIRDEMGYTAFQHAIISRDIETLKILMDYNADIHATWFGMDSLHLACEWTDAETVAFLIEAGLDINSYMGDMYPIHRAVIGGKAEIVRLLIEKGADTEAEDFLGRTPLLLAEENNQTEIINLLKR